MQKKVWHRILPAVLCFLSIAVAAQQSNTRGQNGRSDTTGNKLLGIKKDTIMSHRILLVPFESKMLMSEIGKEVNEQTHLTYAGISDAFRKELNSAMYAAIRRSCVTVSLLDGKQSSDSSLSYIYGSTSYSYDVVPGTTPETGSKTTTGDKNYIHEGQLEVPVDYSKRFMNVSVLNPKLLSDLSAKYNTDTYIFINELDIKNVENTTTNLSDEAYRREVTVHYSIMDNTGHYITKGIAITYFPFNENDPKVIGEKYFSALAKYIMRDYIHGLIADKAKEDQKKQSQSKGLFK